MTNSPFRSNDGEGQEELEALLKKANTEPIDQILILLELHVKYKIAQTKSIGIPITSSFIRRVRQEEQEIINTFMAWLYTRAGEQIEDKVSREFQQKCITLQWQKLTRLLESELTGRKFGLD